MRGREAEKDGRKRGRLQRTGGREKDRDRGSITAQHPTTDVRPCGGPWYTILLRYHTGFVVARSKTAAEVKERMDIAALYHPLQALSAEVSLAVVVMTLRIEADAIAS